MRKNILLKTAAKSLNWESKMELYIPMAIPQFKEVDGKWHYHAKGFDKKRSMDLMIPLEETFTWRKTIGSIAQKYYMDLASYFWNQHQTAELEGEIYLSEVMLTKHDEACRNATNWYHFVVLEKPLDGNYFFIAEV